MEELSFTDIRVLFVLFFKDEMIKKGIIPNDVKWDELNEQEKQDVIEFIEMKLEENKHGRNNY